MEPTGKPPFTILPATPAELDAVRALLREYAAELGVDLCFQNFGRELAELPGAYGPPGGALLVAWAGDQVVGCVAVRRLDEGVAELKRLYLRPAWRGRGRGRALAEASLAAARALGYQTARFDSLSRLEAADALYQRLGWRRIDPYYHNPEPDATFWEVDL